MFIRTASGTVRIARRSPYGKWLQGWKAGHGWTGAATLSAAWGHAQEIKRPDCGWNTLGYLMATEQERGKALYAALMSE